jgi:hypothetical protein
VSVKISLLILMIRLMNNVFNVIIVVERAEEQHRMTVNYVLAIEILTKLMLKIQDNNINVSVNRNLLRLMVCVNLNCM